MGDTATITGPLEDCAEPDEDDYDDLGITELLKIEPDRVDGVQTPANGFPVLMLKSIAPPGGGLMTEPAAHADTAVEPSEEAVTPPEGEDVAKEETPAPQPAEAARDARAAYAKALAEHRAAEPTSKGALDATDFLKAKVDWTRWNTFGKSEGLDGTREGQARWVAKHAAPAQEDAPASPQPAEGGVAKRDFDPDVGGGVDRDKIPAEDFAGKNRSFPIVNAGDVSDALHSIGRAGEDNYDAKTLRRNILRIARRKGFPVPDSAKKASDGDGTPGKKCPTCKGKGKIRGGNMTCPKCKGKGRIMPGSGGSDGDAKKEAAPGLDATQAVALLDAMAKAGWVNADDAGKLIEQATKAAGAGARPLPPEVLPAGTHREPDGTSTIERLEPQAGLPTDPDATPDKVPPSVGKASYEVRRMHDALCPAYTDQAVQEAYPALKSAAGAVMPGWFAAQAGELRQGGKAKKAASMDALAVTALALAGMSPAAVADARAEMAKAVTEGYPDTKVSPKMGMSPKSYHRPYLRTGHAAENAGQWTVNIPPSSHVPEPEQFQRGNLTAGHQAPSPGDHGPNNPHPPGSSGHEYYSTTEKDMARAAMASIHDHVAATFAGMCPMAPTRSLLPPGMGATSGPEHKAPPASMGGISTVGKDTAPAVAPAGEAVPPLPPEIAQVTLTAPPGPGGLSAKDIERITKRVTKQALARALAAHQADSVPVDPAQIEALVAAQVTPLREKFDSETADLRKELDRLGSQPDPAMAPVRGQMARPSAKPAPVEKRSLVDEARQAQVAQAAAERARFSAYMAMQADSPDPKVRERALQILEKQGGAPA